MCAPLVCPFQRATRASPCAMSSISMSSGEGSSKSSRRPDSIRCQARGKLARGDLVMPGGYMPPGSWQTELLRRRLLAPQALRGDVGAFAQRLELEPHHVLGDPLPAG